MNQMTKFSDNKPLGLFHYTHFHFFDHPIHKNDVYFFKMWIYCMEPFP